MNEDRVVLPLLDVDLQEHLLLFALELPQYRVLDVSFQSLLVVLMELLGLVELVAYLEDDSDEKEVRSGRTYE